MNKFCGNIKAFALMVLICMFFFDVNAQDTVVKPHKKRPTVGVVLCGGGAKGFAEIRVLKAIDEAGVPIDFIGGTSIGSIMGSLYAVGYGPDMMEEIVRAQDWNTMIYDKIPKSMMPIEQKKNDRTYLATFPVKNGKIKVKPSLVEGVYVNLMLSKLMLPAYEVYDYNKLSVPFYCIATDVEKTAQYEMNKGNLARSVRASMSIPFFFKPVNIDGKVFVDGGVINNFPVRNMKARGADIIIGVDIENSNVKMTEVDNTFGLVENMMNVLSLEESRYARENCDIYIKPDLHGRGIMAFNEYDSILQFGGDAAREVFPKLKRLADSLQAIEPFEIKRPHVQPVDSIYVADIQIDGVPKEHGGGLVKEFSSTFPKKMSLAYIDDVIVKLSASGYYEDLWYEIKDAGDVEGVSLVLHCKERDDKSMSLCIHYDNNYGIGALVNFTMKNLWKNLNRSTLSMDINIAENPYLKVDFNKRNGKYFRFGANLSVISLNMARYYDSNIISSYSIQDNHFDIYTQFVLTQTQQLRLGAVTDYVHMRDFVGENSLKGSYSLYSYIYLNYYYDNEDVPAFARRGWKVNMTGKYVFFEGTNEDGVMNDAGIQNSFIFHGNVVKSIPIGRKNTLKFGSEVGYKIGTEEVPLFYQFFVGGQSKMRYFDNIVAFTGFNFIEQIVDQIVVGKMAWQWNFYKNLYSTVNFDYGYMSDVYDEWFNSTSFVAGAGLTLGVDTVIGPVEVSVMGSNTNSNPVGFINVGFWF